MPLLKIAKWLPILVIVILVAGAAGARADGPPAPGDGSAAPAAVPAVPVVPVVPTPPVAVPAPPVGVTAPSDAPDPTPPTPPTVPTPPAPTPPTPPAVPTPPPAPTPPTSAPVIPAPIPPVPAPTTPTPPASSPHEPAPIPVQAPTPQPAVSNTTTQTITQVQAAPCTSHCDGGVQVQQASQDNTTVQVVDPGPAGTAGGGATAPPAQTTMGASATGGAQVQVGCMQYCYGTTTLDTSGLTLAQLEQLLGALALPGLPPLILVPGTLQNVTQQASDQSQTGDGQTADPSQTIGGGQAADSSPTGDGGTAGQAQVAAQSNTTVQVVVGTTGAGAGAAAVNQTAQGIWQLQIGCLFDCAGTQQLQQATQSNSTVQAVGGSGAADATVPSAVDTVIRIVWQLQIGCLFWCYDAVEGQTATVTDITVLVTPGSVSGPTSPPSSSSPGGDPVAPQPVAGDAPADAPPVAPGLAAPPDPMPSPPPPAAAGTRGVASAGVLGAALGLAEPRRVHPVLRGTAVTTGSLSAESGSGGALVSVSATRSVALGYSRPATRPARHRERHPGAAHRAHEPVHATAAPARRAAVKSSAFTEPWAVLVLALAAALALATGLRRRFGAR